MGILNLLAALKLCILGEISEEADSINCEISTTHPKIKLTYSIETVSLISVLATFLLYIFLITNTISSVGSSEGLRGTCPPNMVHKKLSMYSVDAF